MSNFFIPSFPFPSSFVPLPLPPLPPPPIPQVLDVDNVGAKLYERLFPGSQCLKRPNVPINLSDFHRQFDSPLSMTDIKSQETLLSRASKEESQCTYGGYLENRTHLWKGLYPLEGKSQLIHLGVDINNLAYGQPVTSLTNGIIFHILQDTSDKTGWGGRVIIRFITPQKEVLYLMYAHLGTILPLPVNTIVKAGDVIGYIGEPRVNGGWFAHLHLQIMTEKYMQPYFKDLRQIDGYAITKGNLSRKQIKQQLEKQGLIDPIEFVRNLP